MTILTLSVAAMLALAASSQIAMANALFIPSYQAIWERHKSNPFDVYGVKATIPIKDPTLVTGTNWWWAKTFVFEHILSYNSDYGALGVGWAKYIPLGSSSAIWKELYYHYDSVQGSQGYSFAASAPINTNPYQAYYNLLDPGCWNLYSTSTGWITDCITGDMTWAHPRYVVTASHSGNTIPGTYTVDQYKQVGTSGWINIGSMSADNYCAPKTTSPGNQKMQVISGGNSINFGPNASSHSCSGTFVFSAIKLPG